MRTFEDYKSLLDRHVCPRIGLRAIAKLSPLDIQGVYSAMLEAELSPRTVRYVHAILRSALDKALRWCLPAVNPADAVAPEEAAQGDADDDRPGARVPRRARDESRAHALSPRGHDGPAAKRAPCDSMGRRRRRGHQRAPLALATGTFEDAKRADSRRTVRLNGVVLAALREHKKRQAEERLAAGAACNAGDLIFPNRAGRPTHWRTLENHYKAALAIAGLSGFRLYDLRQTAATLAPSAGVPPKVISEQLGHSTVSFTMDVYSDVMPEMQTEAAARVEALLFGERS